MRDLTLAWRARGRLGVARARRGAVRLARVKARHGRGAANPLRGIGGVIGLGLGPLLPAPRNLPAALRARPIRRSAKAGRLNGFAAFRLGICVLAWLAACALLSGAEAKISTNEVAKLSSLKLEDILNVEVTSVSRLPEKLFDAAAAVSVITADDIRRSGARSLPEALRLAPGLSVGRIDANKWAVSARGFSGVYSDMLLVMIDGRSVYQVNNGGVNWVLQDYLLEDVERIEVVRGPGGTLWGANAVNGVINIITKSAKDTAGTYVSAGGGTEDRGFAAARVGGKLGDAGWLRAYVKHDERGEFEFGNDHARMTQGGLLFDRAQDAYKLALSADGYGKTYGDAVVIPSYTSIISPATPKTPVEYHAEGANARLQFTRTWGEETELQAQAYYDHERDASTVIGSVQLQDVYDLDTQMRFPVGSRQGVIVGSGYRYLPSSLNNHALFGWAPNDRHQQLFSTFVHDDIQLVKDRLKLTLGTKLEHHEFTGWEVQPNARLAWTPSEKHTVWTAVSRAVQVPGRNAIDVREPIVPFNQLYLVPPATVPLYVSYSGDSRVRSQELLSYELGYRVQPTDRLFVDFAGFYGQYDHLTASRADFSAITAGPVPGTFILPAHATSLGKGQTYGFEVSTEFRPSDWWRLVGSYSLLRTDLLDATGARDTLLLKDPQHQVGLRSHLDLGRDFEFDALARYVDSIQGSFGSARAYFGLDLRLGWRPGKHWEISLVGQNLIEPQHFEYVEDTGVRSEVTAVPRGGYLQVRFRF